MRPLSIFFVAVWRLSVPEPGFGRVGDWTTFTLTNDVQAIAFDRGDVWLATTGGGVRFEPALERFTVFTNTDGLSGNDVSSLAVDRRGDVWFGTRGNGLSRLRRDTGAWRTFTRLDGLASERVNAVTIHGDRLWVGTDDGLSLFIWGFDPDEGRETFVFSDAYRASRGVPVGDVNAIAIDATAIWVATDHGVATAPVDSPNLKDPDNWTVYTRNEGLPSNRVTTVAVSDAGVWSGTVSGAARLDGARWTPVNGGLPALEIRDLSFIDSVLWAATTSEAARLDGAMWTSVGGGVGRFGARAIEGDATGAVWIGTARNGLGRLEQGAWRFFPSSGLAGNTVTSIFIDRAGHIWCGFSEDGVSRFDGAVWTTFSTGDGLAAGPVSMIGQDRSGIRWFGTFGNGVSKLDDRGTPGKADDVWETLDQTNSVFEGLVEDPEFVVVNAWAIDHAGGQWFGNFGVGAHFLDRDGTWTTFRPRAGELSSSRFRGIAVGADSSVWFATDDRLSRYFPDRLQWRVYGASDGLLSPQVNAVAVAPDGVVWVGTDAGINRFEDEAITPLFLPAGLNTAAVTALAVDARGNLWVGARTGVARFAPDTFEWEVFTPDNSPLADPLVNAITIDRPAGEVWIATGRGVSRFESGVVPERTTLTTVLVYPNPFIPSRGDTGVVFGQLADGARVAIFSASGELVRRIEPDEIVAQQAFWNGKNEAGKQVAGGVYFFVITAPDGSHRAGKIAVIQ